jgi:hypothetical protein
MYLSILNNLKKESLFQTNQLNGLYKLQIINVDFQQGEVVDIMVDDRRKTNTMPRAGNDKISSNKTYKGSRNFRNSR